MALCSRQREPRLPIDVPLLGVNLGSLGFLTEVPLQSLYTMLDAIAQGRAKVEHRALMECTLLRGDEVRGSYLVFNDAVVNKTALARLNTYDLYIDGVFVSSYRADGMIVATPTGSTAYSLSAGGPVLMPTVSALLVTPVAPHSLTHRPLVVPDSSQIEILLRSEEEVAYLSLDGQPGLDLMRRRPRAMPAIRAYRQSVSHRIELLSGSAQQVEMGRTARAQRIGLKLGRSRSDTFSRRRMTFTDLPETSTSAGRGRVL